jgi:hypothetical protein
MVEQRILLGEPEYGFKAKMVSRQRNGGDFFFDK